MGQLVTAIMNDQEMMKHKLERYRKLAARAAELGKPDFAAALDEIADDYAKLLNLGSEDRPN